MLTQLFGSTARTKILKLFLFHPEERYYIRQVARELDIQVNSARRELENLKDFGLLISGKEEEDPSLSPEEKKQKNYQEKYYRTNKDFVLFQELRALMAKAQVLYKKDFIRNIRSIGSPHLVVLSGLFVNNDKSEVDLLIVGKIDKKKVKKVIENLEKDLGRELNYTLMSHSEFKYRRDITDIFLFNILEHEKIVVIDKLGISE